jgi:type II secretory pathway pseudopilin PulG
MKTTPPISRPFSSSRAFTLIESVIAIGIFAFVIVGILGLFPAGMKRRADAGAEARARIIAESIFEAIKASDSPERVKLPQAVKAEDGRLPVFNFNITKNKLVGFSQDGTALNWAWPDGNISPWETGENEEGNDITTKALISTKKEKGNLYRVTVRVGTPASLPAKNMTIFSFTSYALFPPSQQN